MSIVFWLSLFKIKKCKYPSRIYGSERVWNVLLGAWQTFSDPMYLEKNIKFHQIFVIGEKNIKIFEHSSPHPFLQAPLHICVICPNPSLGCLPPKSDRRQCSRLCSVLLCMSVLSHASPFVAQNISPPTQYAVSFIGSPFWRQTCYPPPLPEYMLSGHME